VCPEWVEVYEASKRQRDFEEVVTFFGVGMLGMKIEEWVSKVEAGESPRGIRERVEEDDDDSDDEISSSEEDSDDEDMSSEERSSDDEGEE